MTFWKVEGAGRQRQRHVALYWTMAATAQGIDMTRAWLVVILVWLWGVRLTANWATFWPGLEHEDWRYGPIKTNAGKWNALADFSAIATTRRASTSRAIR